MITLLASLAGFFSSFFPEILKFIKDKNDKLHELNILDKQIEFSKLDEKTNLEEIQIRHQAIETQALYNTYKTGINWLDALNGTVRPLLAYSFFGLYSFIKYIQFKAIKNSSIDSLLIEYIDLIWTIDDQAIFAGIISFYYGQRTFNKILRKK